MNSTEINTRALGFICFACVFATLGACASAHRPSMPSAPSTEGSVAVSAALTPRARVDATMQDIYARSYMLKAYTAPGTVGDALKIMSDGTPAPPRPSKTQGSIYTPPHCEDVAEAVCASSAKICSIAERNAQDAYFRERCAASAGICVGSELFCRGFGQAFAKRAK